MVGKIYSGIAVGFEPLVLREIVRAKTPYPILYIVPTEDRAVQLAEQIKVVLPQDTVYYLPAWDCLPYDRIGPSQDVLTQRMQVLSALAARQAAIVVLSAQSLLQRVPPISALTNRSLVLRIEQDVSMLKLIESLSQGGYLRVETVRESGEFAVRGDILDIFPVGLEEPVRLDFFGDHIEKIRRFDALNQTTIAPVNQVDLTPSHDLALTDEQITRFRQNYRERFGHIITPLYEAISEGRRYAGMEHWLPLFFDQMLGLLEFVPTAQIFYDHQTDDAIRTRLELIHDYYHNRLAKLPGDSSPPYNPLKPEEGYLTLAEWRDIQNKGNLVTPFSQEHQLDFHCRRGLSLAAGTPTHQALQSLKETVHQEKDKQIILACSSEGSRDRLMHMLEDAGIRAFQPVNHWPDHTSPYTTLVYPLDHGFTTPHLLVITEADLLGERIIRQPSKQRKTEKLLLETSQLSTGDLIVHRDHGVGRYEGLLPVEVDGALHDCLALVYHGGDKLFLPVENIDAVSKYGDADSLVQLDKLGSSAWQNRKARVKKRIREVADYLIKLAAERSLHEAPILQSNPQDFEQFCAGFPYVETDDQLRAIAETLDDMASGHPMDRLICGDVGFGKTEVALRSAFVAVASGKQVAIIAPTTLLCRQHFQTFSNRFKDSGYRVEQLSRFVSVKAAERIRRDLADGQIDIIVATHALFSEKTKFTDLGLVIIDEEQHFGVKQKEKLKSLQKDVHVLTLTATPIPRTLQLALTGVRQMSLIATPPIDRLAVRTFVTPYDGLVIREAILREYYRGGQIFYVSPRLEDLSALQEQLTKLIPEIKIIVAHGQLSAGQLEDVMTAFYDRQYDLLLSTNIVESGIDIPNANTLVIHRADLFGLAQLYQLRGRVGRSKAQGYAYLTMPGDKPISDTSLKRLEIMQTLDKLGAGFTLASHDLDIRGTGNLVGEEQSGHIREVGVELYQHLLQEAIMQVRIEQEMGTPTEEEWSPQINLGTSVMIPETYVSDLNLRLNLYRRVANLKSREEIDTFAAEMVDRFGRLPSEVQNLLEIIEVKSYCRQAHIEKVDVGPKGIVISLKDNKFPNPANLMTYIQDPKVKAKLRPDQKIVFIREWDSPAKRARSVRIICANLAKLAG
ncbi:transcription-repair coupling factor [Candidatus Odyssella acanthamoebae]|uniref:Transcription-repair-coupling factor n=1 Tax=Candidatus Odyssella acanthamoebae TaxID=91604 RepID=A0A077AT31_9PROT|nr:transcription-repair coupling factor [Candidatus Paracaedibacter acanthamoebae]AIK95521.1 transcription-repair coupling factor [Candidatus Paracaedibacter acanthamoebae]